MSGQQQYPRARADWRRLPPRHVIVALCFLATFTAYVERVGFSIAFTALAKHRGYDEQVKGAVMSAFYWGYGVSQVWGGRDADRRRHAVRKGSTRVAVRDRSQPARKRREGAAARPLPTTPPPTTPQL
jgi:MFS family permease